MNCKKGKRKREQKDKIKYFRDEWGENTNKINEG